MAYALACVVYCNEILKLSETIVSNRSVSVAQRINEDVWCIIQWSIFIDLDSRVLALLCDFRPSVSDHALL
jgi:hypothetical protein